MQLIELRRQRRPGAECLILTRAIALEQVDRACAGRGQADERDRRVRVLGLQAHRELGRSRVGRAMGPGMQDIGRRQDARRGDPGLVTIGAAVGPAGRLGRVELAEEDRQSRCLRPAGRFLRVTLAGRHRIAQHDDQDVLDVDRLAPLSLSGRRQAEMVTVTE